MLSKQQKYKKEGCVDDVKKEADICLGWSKFFLTIIKYEVYPFQNKSFYQRISISSLCALIHITLVIKVV